MSNEAEAILKQSQGIDTNNVDHLVNLVKKNRAEVCLFRVICELSQNSKSYGDSGSKFARSLLRFRESKHPDIHLYVDAMTFGAKAKSNKDCINKYAACHHSTTEIINTGNKLLKST